MKGETYTDGQAVYVRCIGVWYAGTVRKVTPKRVTVDFTTGSGKRRWKLYSKTDASVRATPPTDVPLGRATRYQPCPYHCGRRYDRRKLEEHKATCSYRPRVLTAEDARRMFAAVDEAEANRKWRASTPPRLPCGCPLDSGCSGIHPGAA